MKLTYIGPESVGPHYLESGKRPYGIAFWCNVMYGGKVIPAQYYSTTDTFRDITGCRIEPVCWWHLPAAAPSTEREWFEQQFSREQSHSGQQEGEDDLIGMGYEILYEPEWDDDGNDWQIYVHATSESESFQMGGMPSIGKALDAVYDHWVNTRKRKSY